MIRNLLKSHLHLYAAICFLLLTVAMTWPLVTHLDTHVSPGQQSVSTVPYLNLWTLAWNHHWLKGEAKSYWDANQFYPHQKTLAYSEPQFGMGLLTAPLAFLNANTVLMYNLLLLIFLWGAGMACYALGWELFGKAEKGADTFLDKVHQDYRWAAALTAGILYGFHFYVFSEMGVLQLVATLFPALTLLGIHRFLNTSRWRDALLFCVSFLGCWYTCAYYGLFLSVFVCCFAIKYGYRNVLTFQFTLLRRGITTAVITLICLAPLIFGMQSAKMAMKLSRPKLDVRNLSAALQDYLTFPQSSWLYGEILNISSVGRGMFPGVFLLCLATVGAVAVFKTKATKSMSAQTDTTQRIQLPLWTKQHGIFYIVMAGFAFWLSFGMVLTPTSATGLGAYRILAWISPYNLLYQFFPGFSSIRSPYRFTIFCVLFLAILAGWGILWICQRTPRHRLTIIMPLLVIAVLLELWPHPVHLIKVPRHVDELPRIYQQVKKLPTDATLIELPLGRGYSERQSETQARALYYSTFHWHPIANGYSGFTPRAYDDIKSVIAESTPETLLSGLKTFGIQYILTHEEELNENEKKKILALEDNGLIPVAHEDNKCLYQIATNPTKAERFLPDIASLTFYESRTSPNHVSLCLYYQIDENNAVLTTPWHRRVECDVTWYAHTESLVQDNTHRQIHSARHDTPILVNRSVPHGSKLITNTSNTIVIDLPAPPPGDYRVVVKQRSATDQHTKIGVCRIYENGFVTFEEIR